MDILQLLCVAIGVLMWGEEDLFFSIMPLFIN